MGYDLGRRATGIGLDERQHRFVTRNRKCLACALAGLLLGSHGCLGLLAATSLGSDAVGKVPIPSSWKVRSIVPMSLT